jgi:hypothetical protein
VRALVVEQGWSRGALAGVRALAAAGWTVGVAAPGPRGLALSSRHCARWQRVEPVERSAGAFVESVASAVRAGGYDVVFGAGEAELLALSAARGVVPAVFPHASHEVVLRAVDKARLAEAAAAVGIAVPEVISLSDIPTRRHRSSSRRGCMRGPMLRGHRPASTRWSSSGRALRVVG